jgi:uncharacterized protein (TIGR00266 family)
MNARIEGDNLQMVIMDLGPGETVFGEAGTMVFMSGTMEMKTRMKGGLLGGLKRVVSGESLFITEFTPHEGTGTVAFAGKVPGKILSIGIGDQDFFVQKDAFLCAEEGIELDIAFTRKLGAGFFGGEGFILERLSGAGTAYMHACGDITEITLKEGEELRVSTGLVVGFDQSVSYDVGLVRGVRSVLFSGEGLFITSLKGPGRVFIQSMDLSKLAASIVPYLPQQNTS